MDTIYNLKQIAKPRDKKCEKECVACSRADGIFCAVYAFPYAKWRNGLDCPMADSFLCAQHVEAKAKVRVGQQKQKKGKK